MGRECGYLTLVSALTSGAEMCLIPEIPHNLDTYKTSFRKQMSRGRGYFIALVCEALKNTEEVSDWFEKEIGIESRTVVLGHMQRGGNPTVYDRLMAFDFVTHAIDGLLEGKKSFVVCYNEGGFDTKDIQDVAFKKYKMQESLLRYGQEFGGNL
jgi:6-phosphofructokinase 1